MCLSIPAKIVEIQGENARISVGGAEYDASLQMVDEVTVGDYVLVHTGFAIQKISEEEALETLQLLKALGEIEGDSLPAASAY